MKKITELLAPAGNMTSLIAAISNGCNAIYLGMNKFGARAYANNFNIDELKEALDYAHLRNVKIYVTMNTIIYNNELKDAYKQLNDLYEIGVDGIIVEDLALFDYIVKNLPNLEAHTSTQMGIDDYYGAKLLKDLGAKRIVLAREVPIEKIKEIKKKVNLPIEIFVHGALCVSYSGNCLMSGLIGYRSGNRGRCVGSCRKKYELINETTNEVLTNSYILSMKDLNTIDYINELKDIDSLKIEGRMKEPEYVANVIRHYRLALDNKLNKKDIKLNKTFNRTYTKGYIFHEDKKNITNISRPNNFGYEIGYISKKLKNNTYEIKMNEELNQGDIIRIDNDGVDINLSLQRMYDSNDNLINKATNKCIIKFKEDAKIGNKIYKTKDIKFYNELAKTYPNEYNRIPININIYGEVDSNLTASIECGNISTYVTSDWTIDKAINSPISYELVYKQFNKLNDTPYILNEFNYYIENAFIPNSKLNEIRRLLIEKLNEERLIKRELPELKNITYNINVTNEELGLSVSCLTQEQYDAIKDLPIKNIYYKDNIIRRNENNFKPKEGTLLIGGYGGIEYYKNTNEFITDFSLNVVNHKTAALLYSLGAKRICLSQEMNNIHINELTSSFFNEYGVMPNLEIIVYGRADMMFTHYCPLKVMNQCGKCKQNKYILKDEYGYFPIISHEDCTTTILNGKILNLIDDLEDIKNVNTFRIALTTENKDEAREIVNMYLNKIKDMKKTNFFNKDTDTRGHFNKEIL